MMRSVASGVAAVFCASALLHLAFDFPFHNDDARPHFWPLSDWVFESPLSYWDRAHHGTLVGAAEWIACAVCLVVLWIRFREPVARTMVASGMALQLAPVALWSMMFS